MAKVKLDFEGIEDMIKQLNALDKDVDKAIENALQESKNYVTPLIEQAMTKHVQTGKTKQTIDADSRVENDSVSAYIDVGFDISREIQESGYPVSIFLMYGTPKQSPDKKLYNSIYGGKTKKEIQRIQMEEFQKVLNNN